jgi:hypothetical protein
MPTQTIAGYCRHPVCKGGNMMAYDSQFVIAVLHKGSPVREIGSTIRLPFHSEFKVRLKNKQAFLRAKARVWIDGRQVSNLGDFILQPNETLDLERFLDESMTSGRRFKFVPLSDSRVNDPTDEENGIIKVEFYREKRWDPPIKPSPIKRHGLSYSSPNWQYTNIANTGSLNFTSGGGRGTATSCYVSNSIAPAMDSFIPDNAGATIEGGYSGQSFVYGSDFQTETFPITLQLQIRGLDRRELDWEDRRQPALRPKKRIKFCPNCGAKRHGMAKFCSSCGTAYHPRYERERGSISR